MKQRAPRSQLPASSSGRGSSSIVAPVTKPTYARVPSGCGRAHAVLLGFVRHHSRWEPVRYAATWVLLLVGDVAGGALQLIYAGDEPVLATIVMVALGAGVITAGLLGADLRRIHLALTLDETLDSPDVPDLVRDLFTVSERGHLMLRRIVAVAVACGLGLSQSFDRGSTPSVSQEGRGTRRRSR